METSQRKGANVGHDALACDPNPLYGITIKPTYNSLKKLVKSDPEELVKFFRQYCIDSGMKPLRHEIEIDSKGIPHLHGSMQVELATVNTKHYQGWHLHIKSIYDMGGWNEYIVKTKSHDTIYLFKD